MNKRIIFLLPVAYPTTKAYGVSIGRTVKALELKGTTAEIWANSKSDFDQFGNRIIRIGESNPTVLITFLSSKFKFMRTLAFLLLNFKTATNTTKNIQNANSESTLIVVRELVLAAFLIDRLQVQARVHNRDDLEPSGRAQLHLPRRPKRFSVPLACPLAEGCLSVHRCGWRMEWPSGCWARA